jgi:sporulation protein YlmC with PRC-barrel domain
MPDVDIDTALEWRGRTVVDRDGERIGTLEELYLDERDEPAWATVRAGVLGLRSSLVPLSDMRPVGEELEVPYDRQRVKDAPAIEASEQVADEDADRLRQHYGLDEQAAEREDIAATRMTDAGSEGDDDDRAAPAPASASAVAETDDAMTRSEEELVVGTRRRTRGRARLRKYVVTEHVQKTIPVRREEVRVEFEPEDSPPPEDGPPGES